MTRQLCVVVPCYNEALRLDRGRFEAAFTFFTDVSFLFVEDGSTDDTLALLRSLADAHPASCAVLALPRNGGKAEAVRQGLLAAADLAPHVGYWDADLATPLESIETLLHELHRRPHVELVLGSRVKMLGSSIDRSGARHVIGRAFATLASLAVRLPVYDTQCGAKLLRVTPALRRALLVPFTAGWGFDVELIRRLQASWGYAGADRLLEVPLREWRDVGESKVSLAGGVRAFASLLRLVVAPEPVLPPLPAAPSRTQPRATGAVVSE